jgi:hypothetical protein
MIASLGNVEEPKISFEITLMNITGLYPKRRGKTSISSHLSITWQFMFRRFQSPIILPKRLRGCKQAKSLRVMVQVRPWLRTKAENLSSFFQRTCKILGVRRVRTSCYHASSNGMVERIHPSLHSNLLHYVNANYKNWDEFVSFYLMSHRATPHTNTGYSPFYLLHGTEMVLPSTDNLKARLPKENTDEDQRLENLKSNVRLACKFAAKANSKSI